MKEVCIVGLGYIGLPTALMFAKSGVKVHGVDVSEDICRIINSGGIHIVEPGLEDVAAEVAKTGMFTASTKPVPCSNFIVAVPTPITEDKLADLSYVRSAAGEVAAVLKKGDLVILESTVSPRCTEDVFVPELEKSGLKAGEDFMVAHCPERVLPGQIMYELQHNNKIIGGIDQRSAEAARDLYGAFVEGDMLLTTASTAEMCKLMENTFRDVNIALANELAMLCEKLGINAWDVIELANRHPRVNLHQPGPGVGGHCLAVDPWFIVEALPETAKIIELGRKTNDYMPFYVAKRIGEMAEKGAKIVLLGCTYKPDIDDMRESPITELHEQLEKDGFDVVVCDPYIKKYAVSPEEAAKGADMIVLCVNHSLFNNIDLKAIAAEMRTKVLFDTKNFFNAQCAEDSGFEYHLLGKGN